MRETDPLNADYAAASTADVPYRREPAAVSWPAVIAGAVAMAAFSLILLTLGTGLGLSALSPWPGGGAHPKTFGFAAIVWVCVTQILSAGLGGYLAGRLRHGWPGVNTDEAHFRDTAHGFLAWSLATLVTAALLSTSIAGLTRTAATAAGAESGAHNVGALNRGHAQAAYRTWPMGYLIDGMLRPAVNAPLPAGQGATAAGDAAGVAAQKHEIARIFLNSGPVNGTLSPEDTDYVARIVAQRTGLAPAAARARVSATWSALQDKASAMREAARAAADRARKATIHITLWLFVSLLMGAFAASLFATIGGRAREW